MKSTHIPADGNWHELPEKPVKSIIAPTFNTEVDILPDGTGRARVTRGDMAVKVEYALGEYRVPLSTRRYLGRRTSPIGAAAVTVVEGDKNRALDPRFDLRNHSPDGFQWGYPGSGPSQLALALLADALGDDEKALRFYPEFKANTVARITGDSWEMTAAGILAEVESYEKEQADG
jgi:hypothetical protein